jgi:lysophospholipase L1-like esterase
VVAKWAFCIRLLLIIAILINFVKVKGSVKKILVLSIPFLSFFLVEPFRMDAQQAAKPMKYLALGDSYTIGESVAEAERWPNQLVDSLVKKGSHLSKPTIIAATGWRTDDLKNAMTAAHLKNEYQFVTLLIGVNNQYQGKSSVVYAAEFEDVLKWAIRLAEGKQKRVVVVSIPDYGFTPFGKPKQETITKAIDEFNEINRRISQQHGVQYVNITDLSRNGLKDPLLVAADGLHPSGKMYSYWVEAIARGLDLR